MDIGKLSKLQEKLLSLQCRSQFGMHKHVDVYANSSFEKINCIKTHLNMSALLVKCPCINSGARYLGSPSKAWAVSH